MCRKWMPHFVPQLKMDDYYCCQNFKRRKTLYGDLSSEECHHANLIHKHAVHKYWDFVFVKHLCFLSKELKQESKLMTYLYQIIESILSILIENFIDRQDLYYAFFSFRYMF